ncbi:MAG: TolC family protein [Candidatus Baltobacteraceae bacterium]
MLLTALTLSAAVQYALLHSPSVVREQAALAQTHAQYLRQRAQQFPAVSGSLSNQLQKSQNYSGSYGVIGASQASVFSQNTAQIGTQYTFNGGLSYLQTKAAQQAYEQSRADLSKTQNRIATDVADAFFTLAGKNESVRLDLADTAYQAALVRIARAKEHAGVAAGVDVLSAQAQEEKSRFTLTAAQADSENSRESLAQLIGAPLDTRFAVPPQPPAPPLPVKPVDELVRLAQANRPDVISAMRGLEVAQTNRRAADTDLFPQLQTFASFGNQFSPTLAVQEARFGAVNRGSPGFWQIGLSSSVTLPFLDWGARRANHQNLDAEVATQSENVTATQAQVEIDVRQSYRAAQTALAQLQSAQQESRYAGEAARIARLQYEHGLKSLIDVLAAQQASLSAQTDAYNARVAYVEALVRLRVALGIYDAPAAVADL